MTITSILTLFGGVGMFLYGMNLLGSSLEQIAGAKLEKTLEKLTTTRFRGVALGTITTGIIQSSAATTVMLIGFVNAGIMRLAQSVPVIMGANIGSTVTGQILRLGDVSSDNIFLTLIKPSSFAPLVIAIGAAMLLMCKKKKTKNVAKILIGFGILFMGMTIMEQTVSPLKDNENFRSMFYKFSNPFLGVLVGLVITAIIQSCSASVGILQAIASTGTITFSMAFPIVLGQNLGKCLTVFLGGIGTNKKAKRVSLIYFLFNLIGVVIIMSVIYLIQYSIGIPFWNETMNRGNVADIQTAFNVITTCILLPFTTSLVKLSEIIIKDKLKTKSNHELDILDDIFLKTPGVAIEQSKKVLFNMGKAIQENYDISSKLLQYYDEKEVAKLNENEHFLDKAETVLGEYLVKITSCSLDEINIRELNELMHNVGDFERIGDYCVNIANVAEYNDANKVSFSGQALKELKCIDTAVRDILDITLKANEQSDISIANKVEPLEEVIDALKVSLVDRHLERLKKTSCNVNSGISYVEVLTNLERISDHCSNIAIQVIKREHDNTKFDAHEHLKMLHDGVTDSYTKMFEDYEEKYYNILNS